MKSWLKAGVVALVGLGCIGFPLRAADYHVDAQTGADDRDGLSDATAWRTLERVNRASFQPGDQVRFRAGGVWTGQLVITALGEPGRPVRFGAYGAGSRPRIDTAGAFEDAVLMRNARHVELRDLELTNHGPDDRPRRGVHIVADNCGVLTNLTVAGLFIHDVNGTQRRKDNGGIIFRTLGRQVASAFDGLTLERNIIWRVDRSAIAADSYHANRTRWFPSHRVVIRDNWVGDIGGDGIVPWATDGCLVEHNILEGANERAGTYNAGIWPWSTDNTLLRLNRASGVKTLMDGQGFDSDYNSRNTVLEFNLSHDNEGGFLLICSPGQRKPEEHIGNVGTIARYNLSRHDGARTFHVSAVERTLIHHNAIYVGPGQDVQVWLLSDWSGWARDLEVRANLFHSEGVARYGHQVSRSENGAYGVGPGWGPATDIRFIENRYLGRHLEAPEADVKEAGSAPRPIPFPDWPGPRFDPAHPGDFDTFLASHMAWMKSLMQRQFGREPELSPRL